MYLTILTFSLNNNLSILSDHVVYEGTDIENKPENPFHSYHLAKNMKLYSKIMTELSTSIMGDMYIENHYFMLWPKFECFHSLSCTQCQIVIKGGNVGPYIRKSTKSTILEELWPLGRRRISRIQHRKWWIRIMRFRICSASFKL